MEDTEVLIFVIIYFSSKDYFYLVKYMNNESINFKTRINY